MRKLKQLINNDWANILQNELHSNYFNDLQKFLTFEEENHTIYPEPKNTFSAFNLTPNKNVKVVLIGQDPYHGKNQSNGLCFSVNKDIKTPPSLANIFKELKNDIGQEIPSSGNLEHWAKQGILMLNATLTVRESQAGSHQKQGWEEFTNATIQLLSDKKKDLIFILWGKFAQQKADLIDSTKHHILNAPHPSPFSAYTGFFGCKHFSKTNEILKQLNIETIQWVD